MTTPEITGAGSIERLRSCPLCSGTSWRALPTPGRWIGTEVFGELEGTIGLVKCRNCKLVFTNPRPSTGRLDVFYSGDAYSPHDPAGSSSAGAKADFVMPRICQRLPTDAPRTLLDYGAGGGGFLRYARDHGWQTRGFEPGQRGLASCRQAGLDVTDSLHELSGERFGLVTMHHVLEHLANPVEALGVIRSLLAAQGRLYVEVPNTGSLRARLAAPLLSRRFQVEERFGAFPIHLTYYTPATLRRMLAAGGWVVEKTFSIAIGLDDFFIRAEGHPTVADVTRRSDDAGTAPKRRLRHWVRDVFLGLNLGENLGAIAYPAGR